MASTCLADLADELNGLLPMCPTGQSCGELHTLSANQPCIHLQHLPVGPITITEPCGDTLTADQYVVDWTTGTVLAPCTKAHTVTVTYTYNLAETYIRQAVNAVGYVVRQRNIVQTPVVACCGVVSLPCAIHRILSLNEIDCTAGPCAHCRGSGCQHCRHACRCTAPNRYQIGGCQGFLLANGMTNELVLRPTPDIDAMLEICYEGGYPLSTATECFVDLSSELADLVLLKAQAIAYRNPQLFLSLIGANTGNNSSSDTTGNTDEIITVVKEKTNCGKRETTTTTKKGTSSSSTAAQLSSLSSSAAHWLTLAREFEAAYQSALRLRTESTTLPLRRNGYRARLT